MLYAVSAEGDLENGSDVAYLKAAGDTVIPFGRYGYFGTDSFQYFAQVILHGTDTTPGRTVGIGPDGAVIFDLVLYDNAPDPMQDGLMRVSRDGKMGFANDRGEIVIPCIYDHAEGFENGKARVTFQATRHADGEHTRVESTEWFFINMKGEPVE